MVSVSKRVLLRLAVVAATIGLTLAAAGSGAAASSNDQIVLSGIGPSSVGPSGFWLWSQPGGTNAYGDDGAGNVYFYGLGLQVPVEISNVVLNGNTITEHVESKNGSPLSCDFAATETSRPSAGQPNGWVSFSCTAPVASGSYGATVVISSLSKP